MPSFKICAHCGSEFTKHPRDSNTQWELRQYCSMLCNNRSRGKRPLIDRLMDKVEMIPIAGCWIFTGSTDGRGYGQLSGGANKPPLKAYRVSYILHKGEIPSGLLVRHKCDVPACVNPHHLELGTQKQNMQDASRRGRLNPNSLQNLHPGQQDRHGAGDKSIKEITDGIRK